MNTELQNNDTIEVVKRVDGRLNIRRVRVTGLRKVRTKYVFMGVNLHGDNPIAYQLPMTPVADADEVEDGKMGWIRCEPAVTIDE